MLRLRDETFDPANAAAYNLYLLAGPARLYVAIADVERRKFVVLEEYQLAAGGVPALAAHHDFLSLRGWNAVRMAVTGRAFTLLPAPLFRAGDEPAALRLHHTPSPTETVRHTTHPGLELVNVFAADAELAHWLAATYGATGRLLHHTSALLQGWYTSAAPLRPVGSISILASKNLPWWYWASTWSIATYLPAPPPKTWCTTPFL